MKTAKHRVQEKLPDAYCVKLNTPVNGLKWIVWPGKIQPRGLEQPAIGLGTSPRAAWASVKL